MTISNEIINKKWVLKERPIGMAKKSDFELQEEQMDDISENEIIFDAFFKISSDKPNAPPIIKFIFSFICIIISLN